MEKLDKFEHLAFHATYAVCILANSTASDFELIDLGPERLNEEQRRKLSERGMEFIGVIGIVAGVPRVALAVPLDPPTTSALSHAFVQRIEDAINGVERAAGDGAEWMQRLYNLPYDRHGAN
jgi:hypothetical protein